MFRSLSPTCTVQGHSQSHSIQRRTMAASLPYAELLLLFPRSLEHNSSPLSQFRYKINVFHSQLNVGTHSYTTPAFYRSLLIFSYLYFRCTEFHEKYQRPFYVQASYMYDLRSKDEDCFTIGSYGLVLKHGCFSSLLENMIHTHNV